MLSRTMWAPLTMLSPNLTADAATLTSVREALDAAHAQRGKLHILVGQSVPGWAVRAGRSAMRRAVAISREFLRSLDAVPCSETSGR